VPLGKPALSRQIDRENLFEHVELMFLDPSDDAGTIDHDIETVEA
jgi:hypothetical protein